MTTAALVTRPLRPEHREAYVTMAMGLSARSRALRFHGPKPTLSPREVDRLLDVGHDGAEALAAFDGERIVGIARFAGFGDEPEAADVAIVVADAWQGHGVGDRLLGELLPLAWAAGYAIVRATTMAENDPVHHLLRKHGFRAAGWSGATRTFEAAR